MTTAAVLAGAVFWVRRGAEQELTVAEAFATLAIISLVSAPLSMLIALLPNVTASIACFGRIQEYLLIDDRSEPERASENERNVSSHSNSLGGLTSGSGVQMEMVTLNVTNDSVADEGGVVAENATFTRNGSTEFALRGITIRLAPSTHTMIIGPVGSGKSTLLRAILGEVPLSGGSIQIKRSNIAYCSQTPWLRNIAIRQNIIGNTEYNEAWYNMVIRACALEQDIALFPNKDRSLVGSGGISLSGGQKQRVVSPPYHTLMRSHF
jgi:ATP-binding cassette, subfamily C (CFTR/MRP), member 1